MRNTDRSLQMLSRVLLALIPLGVSLYAQVANQMANQRQWAKEAAAAVNAPLKVVVKPLQQGPKEGDLVAFDVQLQNGKAQAASAQKETQVDLQLLSSSGGVVRSGACKIPANATEGKCTVQAPKAGLYKVRVRPSDPELLEGTGYVLIQPDAGSKKQSAPRQTVPKLPTPLKRKDQGYFYAIPSGIPILRVSYAPQNPVTPPAPAAAPGCTSATSRNRGAIILAINEGGESGGAFRAGLESATIQAFFVADDGGSAPSNILVWLSPDHGELDHQPLVIAKCSISGEAHLSSKYPVKATVEYKVVPESFRVETAAMLQALFVRPIVGIGILPPGTQTLSLIDREPIVAQFFDADGNSVPTDVKRTVKFVSDSSVVSAKDQSIELRPGDPSADTVLLPSRIGRGSIFVTAERLKTATHQVKVVGWMLIAVCLIAGAVGGLISFLTVHGSLYSRLIVGITAGIVLTWAYVFGILPKVDTVVAHNYISVFVVSILGGYLGIKVFDFVLKQLGWAT